MKISILKVVLALVLATCSTIVFAQNVGINSTGAAPAASAMLDVSSTVNGFLVPRMTNAQMNAIVAPVTSLMVYNTTTNCFEFWTGAIWQTIVCICVSPAPGPITGPLAPIINSVGNVYSVAPVGGATGYMWTIAPAGAVITAGQGTTAITVSFGPAITTYTICVYDSSLTCAKSPVTCLNVTTSNCAPGVVRDVSVTAVASATTWTITTTHANDVIMIAADGWSGPLSNAPGTVTVNGANATFIQLGYNAPDNTSDASIWAYAAAAPGVYTIVCTETGLSSPYYLNFAAAYYGNCTPINVSNVTPSGNSFAPSGTETETITTTIANSYIFGSFSFNYCTAGNPTLTGMTQLGAELFVACGINSCQGDVLEAVPAAYTITANDGGAQCAMALAVIHP